MKKIIKYCSMAFAFVAVLLFGSFTEVSAKAKETNRVSISSENDESYMGIEVVEGSKSGNLYYVINDINHGIKLKINNLHVGGWFGSTIRFVPEIHVVKCNSNGVECNNPESYTEEIDSMTLLQNMSTKGYVLHINPEKFSNNEPTNLGDAVDYKGFVSDYGLNDHTYFIVVGLSEQGYWGSPNKLIEYKEFKVVDYSKIGGKPTATAENKDGSSQVKVTITASAKIASYGVKYFATDKPLASLPTNETEFNSSASSNGANIETISLTTDEFANKPRLADDTTVGRNGNVYQFTFTMNLEEGKHYYLMFEDESNSPVVIKDLGKLDDNVPGGEDKPITPVKPNAANTNVGQIVLYVLIGVLVLAAVLLIIQRIIDQRRKVY